MNKEGKIKMQSRTDDSIKKVLGEMMEEEEEEGRGCKIRIERLEDEG